MLYMYVLDLHENILVVLTATGIISLTPYSCPHYCWEIFCRTFKKLIVVYRLSAGFCGRPVPKKNLCNGASKDLSR